MSKKISILSLCFSLVLVSSVFAQLSFAADVETVGDLKVDGEIWSTSGGFKFPDGTTLTTSGLNGLLFNVGFVVDNSNSNAGNLTQGAIKFGTGATGEAIASQRTGSGNINGLDLYTNSIARLSIANNGYVGIGTNAPAFPLDVRQNRSATYARFGLSGSMPLYVIASQPHLGFNIYYESGYKYGVAGYAGYLAFSQDVSGGFSFATAPSGIADAAITRTVRMAITNDGKVGIGTTAPTEALDVVGNLKVSGAITPGSLAANSVNTAAIADGSVTAAKLANGAVTSAKIWVDGNFSLNNNELKLLYGDDNHGLGWYGAGKLFAGANVDGPVLYGYSGGALGSTNGGQKIALSWDSSGNVTVPTKVSAGPGQTGMPLAYGVVNSDGSCTYKSANVTCTKGGTGYYYITIANESYDAARYITLVTPHYNTSQLVPFVDSFNQTQLAVTLKTPTGTFTDNRFYFVTYKP